MKSLAALTLVAALTAGPALAQQAAVQPLETTQSSQVALAAFTFGGFTGAAAVTAAVLAGIAAIVVIDEVTGEETVVTGPPAP